MVTTCGSIHMIYFSCIQIPLKEIVRGRSMWVRRRQKSGWDIGEKQELGYWDDKDWEIGENGK